MNDLWQDPSQSAADRARDLLGRLTLEEKLGQLVSLWEGSEDAGEDQDVAPLQHEMSGPVDAESLLPHGLGQLTRPFGTAPVEPTAGARALLSRQREVMAANRFGIPAQVHEECLTGFTAWQATVLPTPLAWGATFHPELVERAARQMAETMRAVGVHQGLSPVLDVVRDPRWGRTEESVGEDPYLVGTVGAAYVRGLEGAGVVATLKHLAGYSASRGARNHAPVSIGPRELADVLLPPFETALREGGARSVMHAYNDLDGVPAAASHALLTDLLRDEWGFTGTVVADYFGISFLERAHRVADSPAGAAAVALAAGVDVELPAIRCYGAPLLHAVRNGDVPEELVDRAALRVLTQKAELGLLDPDWSPVPAALADGAGPVSLNPPALRATARRLAEESVVLAANDGGVLPVGPDTGLRVAVVGALADDPAAMLGCYTFPRHVGVEHPELPLGVEVPTVLDALRDELPAAQLTFTPRNDNGDGARAAAAADLCVVVAGDRSGLFGRGTSGEGCDVPDLTLPDGQGELLDAVLESGTPVVLVLLTGRPYALGRWADRLAAVVQAFFPGQAGGSAVAGVLSGRVNPSGRLPVSVPRGPGGQPWTYLQPPLGLLGGASSIDPTPLYPFGHGLSYTSFGWEDATADADEVATDGSLDLAVTVRNTGDRAGSDVVQLYLHDPVARVARPQNLLVGYARVTLEPGDACRVRFRFPTDLASYTVEPGRRIVEPGPLELRLAASSADVRHRLPVILTGPERTVGHDRRLTCPVEITPVSTETTTH